LSSSKSLQIPGGDIRLNFVLKLITASTSQSTLGPTEEGRIYLDLGSLRFAKTNSKVQEVDKNNPTNRRGYTFLGFCDEEVWTARKCKAVYEYLNGEGYNWYALSHDRTNGRPYLGKRVPQVDKYNFPPPRTAEQIAEEEAMKQAEYQTDYDSDLTNLKQTKETHSTDEELNKETSLDASIIRNSPIGTRPKLSPTILTIMSTTTTQPTITVQAASTTATTTGTIPTTTGTTATTSGTTATLTQ